MSGIPAFVTHAGNFTTAVSGGVDPRTGLYGANISLGSITGNRGLGPVLSVTMNYSPMASLSGSQSTSLRLGAGVSLGLTVYDAINRLLLLSTGERYKVLEPDISQGQGNGQLQLDQTLLDTLHFEKDDDCYKVVHKSGYIEILMGPGNASDLKSPTQLLTPAGHALTFHWDFSASPPLLESITDDTTTDGNPTVLLAFDAANSIFEFLPAQQEGYKVTLSYKSDLDSATDYLTGITNQATSPSLEWTLNYDWVGDKGTDGQTPWGKWLVGINGPGGMTESATYRWWDSFGHQFPDSALLPGQGNYPPLPAVYLYTRHPGANQPDVQTTYDYSDTNFLGYKSGVLWSTEQDNLYNVIGDYQYTSTETCGETVTTRTYDKYHLQTIEVVAVVSGQTTLTTRTTQTTYYTDYTVPFSQQEKKYAQLPKTTTVTWAKGQSVSQPITTTYDWDEWANPVSRIEVNGLVTTWSYYDGSQDDPNGDCPKDPNGFTRFAKWIKVDPTGVSGAEPGAPIQQVNYKYAAVMASS